MSDAGPRADDRSADNRTAADVLALLLGVALVVVAVVTVNEGLLLAGSYGLLWGTSTTVVTFGLTRFTGDGVVPSGATTNAGPSGRFLDVFSGRALETDSDAEQDTGWLIGRMENVIVLTLVYAGEFTALSIVFAAKSFLRREDISSGDTAYYLAGTLLNFTYSIAIGIGVRWAIGATFP